MSVETTVGFITLRKETTEDGVSSTLQARADYDTLVLAQLDCPQHIRDAMERKGFDLSQMQDSAYQRWIGYQLREDEGSPGFEVIIGNRRVLGSSVSRILEHPVLDS